MANPAVQRSGERENEQDGISGDEERPKMGAFATHTTADLIALRNRLLEEFLDLEDRTRDAETGQPDPTDDCALVRERIDEIHQELAMRDLAERVGAVSVRRGSEPSEHSEKMPEEARPSSHIARKSAQILDAIEMRSRFMDELAQAARDEGRLDQAATFSLNAQKLDMERVEVLRQLNALLSEKNDSDE